MFFSTYLTSSKILKFNLVHRDEWVAQQAQAIPGGHSVLDVGAGACRYRTLFAHCDYKAQDFAALTVEQYGARRGYGSLDYVCDAASIPVPDNTFDVILCTEVLEHVPEPIKVVNEMCRILRPGGKLLLSAPLGSGVHQAPWHFYGGYTPFWYEKFLSAAGFADVSVQPNGGFFRYYGQESIRFVRMTIPWRIKASWPLRLLWLPIWLLLLPWLAVLCPLLGAVLDRYDEDRHFTVGYHVSATKKGGSS
jgi:ubiquinone/menaquinone biosynthesis C-methylase UbiE